MGPVHRRRTDRPRHVLSDGVDGHFQLQDQPGDLPRPVRPAGGMALGQFRRGLAGRRARPALRQFIHCDGRGRCHHRHAGNRSRFRLHAARISGTPFRLSAAADRALAAAAGRRHPAVHDHAGLAHAQHALGDHPAERRVVLVLLGVSDARLFQHRSARHGGGRDHRRRQYLSGLSGHLCPDGVAGHARQ